MSYCMTFQSDKKILKMVQITKTKLPKCKLTQFEGIAKVSRIDIDYGLG